jgi:hypothetical protein
MQIKDKISKNRKSNGYLPNDDSYNDCNPNDNKQENEESESYNLIILLMKLNLYQRRS